MQRRLGVGPATGCGGGRQRAPIFSEQRQGPARAGRHASGARLRPSPFPPPPGRHGRGEGAGAHSGATRGLPHLFPPPPRLPVAPAAPHPPPPFLSPHPLHMAPASSAFASLFSLASPIFLAASARALRARSLPLVSPSGSLQNPIISESLNLQSSVRQKNANGTAFLVCFLQYRFCKFMRFMN